MKGIIKIFTIILLLAVLAGCSSETKADSPSAKTQNQTNQVARTKVVEAADFETLEKALFDFDDSALTIVLTADISCEDRALTFISGRAHTIDTAGFQFINPCMLPMDTIEKNQTEVTIIGDVHGSVQAGCGIKVSVCGNVYGTLMSYMGAEIAVSGDLDGEIHLFDGGMASVTGNVKSQYVDMNDESNLHVGGNMDIAGDVTTVVNSMFALDGNFNSGENHVLAVDNTSNVVIGGNAHSLLDVKNSSVSIDGTFSFEKSPTEDSDFIMIMANVSDNAELKVQGLITGVVEVFGGSLFAGSDVDGGLHVVDSKVDVNGSVLGEDYGIIAQGENTLITITNQSYCIDAKQGAQVITGTLSDSASRVIASDSGTKVTIKQDFSSSEEMALIAQDGGAILVEGDVKGGHRAVYAILPGSRIEIRGDVYGIPEPEISECLFAVDGAEIVVDGDVYGMVFCESSTQTTGKISIGGNVSRPVQAYGNAVITIAGDVMGYVDRLKGGKVTVGGNILNKAK